MPKQEWNERFGTGLVAALNPQLHSYYREYFDQPRVRTEPEGDIKGDVLGPTSSDFRLVRPQHGTLSCRLGGPHGHNSEEFEPSPYRIRKVARPRSNPQRDPAAFKLVKQYQ